VTTLTVITITELPDNEPHQHCEFGADDCTRVATHTVRSEHHDPHNPDNEYDTSDICCQQHTHDAATAALTDP